jgi:hypothetical protein
MKTSIFARLAPENIDMLSKIIEAYEYLGIVSTLERDIGMVLIRATEDTYADLMEILSYLPFPLEIVQE